MSSYICKQAVRGYISMASSLASSSPCTRVPLESSYTMGIANARYVHTRILIEERLRFERYVQMLYRHSACKMSALTSAFLKCKQRYSHWPIFRARNMCHAFGLINDRKNGTDKANALTNGKIH